MAGLKDPLPRLPGRVRSYAMVLGSAGLLAATGVAVPLIFGAAPSPSAGGGAVSLSQLPLGSSATPLATGGEPGAVPEALPSGGLPTPSATAGEPGAPDAAGLSPGDPAPGGSPGGGVAAPPASGAPTAPLAPSAGGTRTSGAPTPNRTGTTTRPPTSRAPGVPGGPASGGGGAGPTGGGGTATVPRTASDQGVTADTLTLGVLLVDLGGAVAAGANNISGYDPDEQLSYYRAYVDEVNAAGGINGRRVTLAPRTFSITSTESQQAACKAITETDKAFVVSNIIGFYGPPLLCVAIDHKTPYISNDGAVDDYYKQAGGYIATIQPSTRRTFFNMVDQLAKLNEIKAGDRVGVLREDSYLTADSLALEDSLRQVVGKDNVADAVMSATDVTQFPGQASVAAQRFCADPSTRVSKVFLAVNSLYATSFITNVDRYPGCAPAYYTSDFDFQMAGDDFVKGQPDSYFTRAIGVSSSRVGDPRTGRPLNPLDRECLDVYNRRAGTSVQPVDQEAARAVGACGMVRVFRLAAERAGVNPTRASFVNAIANLGAFDNPGYTTSTFRPGKYDAPDGVRFVQAEKACKCWKVVGDGAFTTARFR